MFGLNVETIKGLIGKVVKQIEKSGNQEEIALAHSLVDAVIPKEPTEPILVYSKAKGYVKYKDRNGKEWVAKCQKDDKFDLYKGSAIALGRAYYHSNNKFYKTLKEDYGLVDKEFFETIALYWAYGKYYGKPNFEKMVDNLIPNSCKMQEQPKTETKTEETKATE